MCCKPNDFFLALRLNWRTPRKVTCSCWFLFMEGLQKGAWGKVDSPWQTDCIFFCLRSYWFASSFHVIGHGKIENSNSQSQHEEQGEGGIVLRNVEVPLLIFFFPHRTIFLFLFKAFFNKPCVVFNKVKLFAHFFPS